jgi:hypothetical protein
MVSRWLVNGIKKVNVEYMCNVSFGKRGKGPSSTIGSANVASMMEVKVAMKVSKIHPDKSSLSNIHPDKLPLNGS